MSYTFRDWYTGILVIFLVCISLVLLIADVASTGIFSVYALNRFFAWIIIDVLGVRTEWAKKFFNDRR